MRIAHVVPVFPPYRGGMGNVAFHQARYLAELGVAVTVFVPRGKLPPIQPHGVDVVSLPPLLAYGNAACLPQVICRTRSYDLIHLHYPFFGTAELLAARRLAGGPPLLLHYQFDVVGEGWMGRLFRWHRLTLLPLVLRAADRIIVSSRDYLSESFLAARLSSLESRIVALPNGVDLEEFHPGTSQHERPAAFQPGRSHVLFVGGLDRAHYFKGLHVLLQALALLPNVGLVIVGTGELRSDHESSARSLGIGDRVKFVGGVSDRELPGYYRAADAVVLPSLDRTEAFGLVLLEAMASGTPVVASSLPGVRALIEEGINGHLATPGDARSLAGSLSRCLENAREIGSRGRALVERKFGWRDLTRDLLEIYRDTIEKAP